MRKGKPEFTETDTDENPPDFSFTPVESAYLAYQDKRKFERKPLRPSDLTYNRNISQLFDTVIPGLPIDTDLPQTRPPVTPFSQIIEQTLKRLDIKASPFLDALTENWPRILPTDIATVTRPAKWDNGILYVCVPTHTQLFELRRTAHAKIKQAVTAFATDVKVRDIHLMIDHEPPTKRKHHAT